MPDDEEDGRPIRGWTFIVDGAHDAGLRRELPGLTAGGRRPTWLSPRAREPRIGFLREPEPRKTGFQR